MSTSRNVYTLDDRVDTYKPSRFTGIDTGSIRSVLDSLDAAGLDCQEIRQKFDTAIDAAGLATLHQPLQDADLLNLDPDAITALVRSNALALGLTVQLSQAHTQVADAIARSAAAELDPYLDAFVGKMRSRFDKAMAVITAAHKAGLTSTTDADALAQDGTPKQLSAFRAMPAALTELDQIASVRTNLTRTMQYGPAQWEVAAYVTGCDNRMALEGAHSRYLGETENVQYNAPFTGSAIIKVNAHRFGGRWLALVAGGHTVRLNTGDEAQAVLDDAHKAA